MIDLRSYKSIEAATLVKWVVPNFDTAFLTDYTNSLNAGGDVYVNIGKLLGVSDTTSELTSTPGEITVTLSGVPTNAISDILNQEIKGSQIIVARSYFDSNTHAMLLVDGVSNTFVRFNGIVTNYAITDSVDLGAEIAVSTITLTCASSLEILSSKTNGRRTNPEDFPNEDSMNRVRPLANSNFNFGAP